jgi:hypothetical protein
VTRIAIEGQDTQSQGTGDRGGTTIHDHARQGGEKVTDRGGAIIHHQDRVLHREDARNADETPRRYQDHVLRQEGTPSVDAILHQNLGHGVHLAEEKGSEDVNALAPGLLCAAPMAMAMPGTTGSGHLYRESHSAERMTAKARRNVRRSVGGSLRQCRRMLVLWSRTVRSELKRRVRPSLRKRKSSTAEEREQTRLSRVACTGRFSARRERRPFPLIFNIHHYHSSQRTILFTAADALFPFLATQR